MKVAHNYTTTEFRPVTISFTCETREELLFFKELFNPQFDWDDITYPAFDSAEVFDTIKDL